MHRVDILKAYDIGIARKAIKQHRDKFFKLRDVDNHEFIDIYVDPMALMAGKSLMDFPQMDECVIVAVHHNGQTIVAHGNTDIHAGDRVTAYVSPEQKALVLAQFKSSSQIDTVEGTHNV